MALKTQVRKDKFLTQVSLEYSNPDDSFIAERLSPRIDVNLKTGDILNWGQDHLRQEQTLMSRRSGSNMVEFGLGPEKSYRTIKRGLHSLITDDDIDEYGDLGSVQIDITKALTELMFIDREIRVSAQLTLAANFTNSTAYGSNDVRWDAYRTGTDNSEPDIDIEEAVETVRESGGVTPNVIAMDWKIARVLVKHPDFTDKSVIGVGPASYDKLVQYIRDYFGLEPFIGKAMYVSGNETAASTIQTMTPIWGKDVFLGHVKENPGRRSKTCAGTFNRKPGRETRKWDQPNPEGQNIQVREKGLDEKLLDELCGYVFTNVIQ